MMGPLLTTDFDMARNVMSFQKDTNMQGLALSVFPDPLRIPFGSPLFKV